MTLIIELTPEQEAALQAQASAAGLDATEYARQLLASDLADLPLPKTGAEAIAYWRRAGVFGLFADRGDAQEYARHLRATVWGSSDQDEEEAPRVTDCAHEQQVPMFCTVDRDEVLHW